MPHNHDHGHHHGPGHNGHRAPLQWQTPHQPDHQHGPGDDQHGHETDLDLVEAAFLEGFAAASDPTSFLRLAGVPFSAEGEGGAALVLLRVETATTTDIGLLTRQLGGEAHQYAPLPSKLVETRQNLALIYFDGTELRSLTLAEARALCGAEPAAASTGAPDDPAGKARAGSKTPPPPGPRPRS